jgi:hypothetical protein
MLRSVDEARARVFSEQSLCQRSSRSFFARLLAQLQQSLPSSMKPQQHRHG